jgi:glycosyltransferase involved in cell wall biosynthesis
VKISGFSMVRNAQKLYYPVREMICSALPVVDEFIIAVGKGDEDDKTRETIESIGSEKIKIIDTVWDLEKYPRGTENAHQTDIAKEHCSGDWLLYLQADEVIHEQDHEKIVAGCKNYLDDTKVEGFLFKYHHFWGDFNHYHHGHGWYPHEIRIVRNDSEIHSWESAQSFRRIPQFDGQDYRQQKGTYMLGVVLLDARIYHYGWVRPPELMKSKTKALATIHKGEKLVDELDKKNFFDFDYGPLNRLKVYKGTHPEVMKEWIALFNWKDKLQYSGKPDTRRKKHKHELLRNRVFSCIKRTLPFMKHAGDFKNYILLDKNKYPENRRY